MSKFNGLGMNLGNLSRYSSAKSRSISAENPTGEKGSGGMATDGFGARCARDLGPGWKINPAVNIEPGEVHELAHIEGPGAIQSIWMSGYTGRDFVLRVYWDGLDTPSIEVPLADFFALPWGPKYQTPDGTVQSVRVNSTPVMVAPLSGQNCFWEMPFRTSCRMTMENIHPTESKACFYQINYTLTDVPDDCLYFHSQFRRVNPLPYKDVYTIIDGVSGTGHYVGTSMGWGINNNRWWGEGEIKFYIDGDEFPTICGTGTEDYFGGSYNWDVGGEYHTYTGPFLGMHQVIKPDGLYNSQHRHAMYRWHIMDPIRFERDLKVTIQALGWRDGGRYLPGQHDICSVAYWYQTLPCGSFPEFPSRDELEIV